MICEIKYPMNQWMCTNNGIWVKTIFYEVLNLAKQQTIGRYSNEIDETSYLSWNYILRNKQRVIPLKERPT